LQNNKSEFNSGLPLKTANFKVTVRNIIYIYNSTFGGFLCVNYSNIPITIKILTSCFYSHTPPVQFPNTCIEIRRRRFELSWWQTDSEIQKKNNSLRGCGKIVKRVYYYAIIFRKMISLRCQ